MSNRTPLELDIENLVGYFLVKFFDGNGNLFASFEQFEGQRLDIQSIANILAVSTIYTFNGTHYDLPILTLALHGATCEELKAANDLIIRDDGRPGLKSWEFYKHFGIQVPYYIDHVDLYDVSPGVKIGLKMYGGRMHTRTMQDIPAKFDVLIEPHERPAIDQYCGNDLIITHELRIGCAERLALREIAGQEYGIDLRSRSDAQMAEAIIKAEWARMMFESETKYSAENAPGFQWLHSEQEMHAMYPHLAVKQYDHDYNGRPRIVPRYCAHGFQFKYQPPAYLRYVTPQMQHLLQMVSSLWFTVTDKEEAYYLYGDAEGIKTGVQIPAELKGMDIRIGSSVYRIGIGGLHSQESNVKHHTIKGVVELSDHDVTSYYPNLIRSMGMSPLQLGPLFQKIYDRIYHERLAAKKLLKTLDKSDPLYAATKAKETGYKIVLNGAFGKLFSKYSRPLYAPEFGIATTVTGQLALLMLIEMLEVSGITVVSANTDGIQVKCPWHMRKIRDDIIRWWEHCTSLPMETQIYSDVFARDVNNYFAFTLDGEVKRKGVFGESGLLAGPAGKHPDKDICAEAVIAYARDGTPISHTIKSCTDIRKFLQVRNVKGGGAYLRDGGPWKINYVPDLNKKGEPIMRPVSIEGGEYLGKSVRWYQSTTKGYIAYIGASGTTAGNKVAGSEGAAPLMVLPDHLPADIDYAYYINHAEEMLDDVGFGIQF